MKIHKLARQLELLARLLRKLPDVELDLPRLPDLQGLVQGIGSSGKESNRQSRSLPEGIETRLAAMSPAEIEKYLSSDLEVFTSVNLNELANRLGLTTSKRQSKSALVNLITRHYEAGQMHSIFSRARPEES